MTPENQPTRRGMLMNIGILLNGVVAAVLAVPVVRYLLSSLTHAGGYGAWVSIGPSTQFPKARRAWRRFAIPMELPPMVRPRAQHAGSGTLPPISSRCSP
jgi:hypothetical protein